ncbi:MAG: hypothetical protein ACRDQ0_23955, partial [Pseudonocardia sp.]
MVAPRSLPDPLAAVRRRFEADAGGRIDDLAIRWAQLIHGDARVAAHLATLLRKLVATVHAEPFWPLSARGIGAELVTSGLCGHPDGGLDQVEDDIVPSLRLLRLDAPAALGLEGRDGERRLAAALDELVAGVVGALRHRMDRGRPDRRSEGGSRHLRGVS